MQTTQQVQQLAEEKILQAFMTKEDLRQKIMVAISSMGTSGNEKLDAIMSAVEMYNKGREPLIPLDDASLEDMDRDALEAAYRQLRASNQKYWKGITESHTHVLQLQKELEAANKGREEVAAAVTPLDVVKLGRNKPFFIDTFRKLLGQYDNDEISISKLVETLNVEALQWHQKQIPQPTAAGEREEYDKEIEARLLSMMEEQPSKLLMYFLSILGREMVKTNATDLELSQHMDIEAKRYKVKCEASIDLLANPQATDTESPKQL